jgi:peptidoglycan/xylan/chitin deacetylase (PgdA/CDA1 family)
MAPVIVIAALIGTLVGLGLAKFPVPSYVQRIAQRPAPAPTSAPSAHQPAPVSPGRSHVNDATRVPPHQTPEPSAPPAADTGARDAAPSGTLSPGGASPETGGGTATAPPAPAPQDRPAVAPVAKKPYRRMAGLPGEVAYVKGAGSKIALTFDAGASGDPAKSILATLRNQGIHVTFFLTGKWAETYPSLVKRISDDGHEIANHTYSHPDLRKLSTDAVEEQLSKTDRIIQGITGEHTAPLFRPPFGGRDSRVLAAASEAGYRGVYWSLDSWDSFKKGITSREIADRVLERAQAGDIVLLHCGSAATAEALPEIIRTLKSRGLQIVTVSELIGQ